MHPLYEFIDNSELIVNGEVNMSAIQKMSYEDIIEYSEKSAMLTQIDNLPFESSLFSCLASGQLGGGAFPCAGIECRSRRIDELMQFSALYGDRVYIYNFLSRYLQLHHEESRGIEDDTLQSDFANDLFLLEKLRPLVEAGYIVPVSLGGGCPICVVNELYSNPNIKLKAVSNKLASLFDEKISASISYNRNLNIYDIHIKGPEYFIEHGAANFHLSKGVPQLASISNVISKLIPNKSTSLTANAIKRVKLGSLFAEGILDNVAFDLLFSQSTKTSFLTERQLEIDFLKELTDDPIIEERNQIALKHLTSFVPFIRNISAKDLLRLRKEEEEAFLIFRSSLTKAFLEYKQQSGEITERDAKAIYQDIVQPQIAKIDQKIKEAKRSLFEGTAVKILGWTGAITIGLYTGFIPPESMQLGTAVGLTQAMAGVIEYAINQTDLEKKVVDQNMYFLWKVKKLSI